MSETIKSNFRAKGFLYDAASCSYRYEKRKSIRIEESCFYDFYSSASTIGKIMGLSKEDAISFGECEMSKEVYLARLIRMGYIEQ